MSTFTDTIDDSPTVIEDFTQALARVGQLGGIQPSLLLALERDVRPGLVRVACEEKPLGDTKPGVVGC